MYTHHSGQGPVHGLKGVRDSVSGSQDVGHAQEPDRRYILCRYISPNLNHRPSHWVHVFLHLRLLPSIPSSLREREEQRAHTERVIGMKHHMLVKPCIWQAHRPCSLPPPHRHWVRVSPPPPPRIVSCCASIRGDLELERRRRAKVALHITYYRKHTHASRSTPMRHVAFTLPTSILYLRCPTHSCTCRSR